MQGLEHNSFLSKNIHSYLDLEPSILKVELARDIRYPTFMLSYIKIHLINAGTRSMAKFSFSKNSRNNLDFDPSTLKVELARYYNKHLYEVILKSINKCRH